MTPQTIEALLIAGFALLAAVLAGIRVVQLQHRRSSGPPLEVYRAGDAWAAKGRRDR
jgi:hypothetical protein